MVALFGPHLVDHTGVFGSLGGLSAFLTRFKDRRRIGHRIIQPKTVEFIPKVVVITDVFACLRFRVALHPETHTFVKLDQFLCREPVIDVFSIIMHEVHHGHKIRRSPPPIQIGF